MRTLLRVIDAISDYTGRTIRWLCVVLILVLVFEVTGRHVFNSPTQWVHQTSLMMSGAIVVMGWAYTHRHHGHVRVDILYSRFPPRVKALTDVILDILVFFPLLAALTYAAWNKMWYSWEFHEVMTETYWYPPVAPNRTVVFIGIALLAIQGTVNFIRDFYRLIWNKSYD